jgi:altronate dehydratase
MELTSQKRTTVTSLYPACEEESGRLLHSINARLRRESKSRSSGLDMNPSPGNIRDGLVTDSTKSAGAAQNDGKSPVTGVLDYAEYSTELGLNL